MYGCNELMTASAEQRAEPSARALDSRATIAGPGLLPDVLTAKFSDHLPLDRQAGIAAHQGVELERSTLADWVVGASALFAPLVQARAPARDGDREAACRRHPVSGARAGNGSTKAGIRWTYVRDDRMYTLFGTAKLNGLDPEAYLRNLVACIVDHPSVASRSSSPGTSRLLTLDQRVDDLSHHACIAS